VFCDDVAAVVIEVVAMGYRLFDIILLVLSFLQIEEVIFCRQEHSDIVQTYSQLRLKLEPFRTKLGFLKSCHFFHYFIVGSASETTTITYKDFTYNNFTSNDNTSSLAVQRVRFLFTFLLLQAVIFSKIILK